MKFHYLFTMSLAGALLLTACDTKPDAAEQAEDTNEERFSDDMEDMAELMVDAYALNDKIVAISQIAANQTGIDSQVQDFARQLQTDHQGVQQQLSSLASTYNIALPQGAANDQREVEKLREAEPDDFVEDFLEMVDDANEGMISKIKELEDEAEDANNEIASYAQQLMSTLEAHDQRLEEMEGIQ